MNHEVKILDPTSKKHIAPPLRSKNLSLHLEK